jgi:uncharacterized protein YbjQ (UPF0145 family)
MDQLIILAILVSLGYFFGKRAEKRHYKSIREREQKWLHQPTTTRKRVAGEEGISVVRSRLVTGSVVISVDYFKRILAGLRTIFGGNVQSYETLVDRARREAVLRMKESCPDADQVINMRLETSSISKGNKKQVGAVEVLAYGTAVYLKK